jgi:hypothetical protein
MTAKAKPAASPWRTDERASSCVPETWTAVAIAAAEGRIRPAAIALS